MYPASAVLKKDLYAQTLITQPTMYLFSVGRSRRMKSSCTPCWYTHSPWPCLEPRCRQGERPILDRCCSSRCPRRGALQPALKLFFQPFARGRQAAQGSVGRSCASIAHYHQCDSQNQKLHGSRRSSPLSSSSIIRAALSQQPFESARMTTRGQYRWSFGFWINVPY